MNDSPSHTGTVASGMLWTTFSVAVTRAASLVSQFALGWLLSEDDFGVYAIAISLSSVVSVVRNGGVYKILLQRGAEYERLTPSLTKIALLFNLVAFAILISAAPFAAHLYGLPQVIPLLWIIGATIPLGTPVMALRAKLAVEGKFATMSHITMASSIIMHSTMIVFALLGFGVLSFVIPVLISTVFENAAFWRATRSWPFFNDEPVCSVKIPWKNIGWIMMGALVLAINLRGEYLVIGWFESSGTLGIYYFAFQISIAIGLLFTISIDSVMLPSFARLSSDLQRQGQAYLSSIRAVSFISYPLVVGVSVTLDPLIRFLWAGKWDAAILPSQVLMLTMLTRVPMSLGLVLMEARGRWMTKTVLMGIDGLFIMTIVGLSAWAGGLELIAISASTYRLIAGLLISMSIASLAHVSTKTYFRSLLSAASAPIIAGAIALGAASVLSDYLESFEVLVITVILFGVVFAGTSALFFRKDWTEILYIFKNRLQN